MGTDGVEFQELIEQVYAGNGARFSAGFVEGHQVDTMYLRLERPGEDEAIILLRPDEAAIIGYLMTGVLWSWTASAVVDGRPLVVAAG